MVAFEDVLQEVGLMLSDLRQQADVVQLKSADDIEAAKQQGVVGFLPTLEHLAIGKELHRLDILYHMGIRLAGRRTPARTTSAMASTSAMMAV